MKRTLFLAFVVGLLAPVEAANDCRSQSRVRSRGKAASVTSGSVEVVAFAQPQAVIVLTVQQPVFFYAYSCYAPQAVHQPAVPAAAESSATGNSDPVVKSESLVKRSCVSCHGGQRTEADLDLSDLRQLSHKQRLNAVARVVSDDPTVRMPKGRTLTPAEIGEVLQELSHFEKGGEL